MSHNPVSPRSSGHLVDETKKSVSVGTWDHIPHRKSQLLDFGLLLFSKAWILLDRDLVMGLKIY